MFTLTRQRITEVFTNRARPNKYQNDIRTLVVVVKLLKTMRNCNLSWTLWWCARQNIAPRGHRDLERSGGDRRGLSPLKCRLAPS